MALAIDGDLDGAIDALEASIEAERRNPMHRTGAFLDQALLVALAQRTDMYDTVLTRLEAGRLVPFEDQLLSEKIARALISGESGEDVADIAVEALATLEAIEGSPEDLPGYLSVDMLKRRLRALADR